MTIGKDAPADRAGALRSESGRIANDRAENHRPQADRGNGTELTSNAILAWTADTKVDWHCINPGTPVQNVFIERFNGACETSS